MNEKKLSFTNPLKPKNKPPDRHTALLNDTNLLIL